jgi:DNA processing protein
MVRLEEFDAESAQAALEKSGVRIIAIDQSAFPDRLLNIPDPPVFLSYRGDLSLLRQPTIGLVGTRDITPYGKRVTQAFVEPFVRAGMVTVSGLALGIDALVAEETMQAGGKTVAVLGNGLATIYPKQHERLAGRILESGGLILSEFPLTMQPDKYTFPARNRIIAALSIATVVLEAPAESGAIITAEFAQEYGREVFAVPGQIFDDHYAGCHALIAGNRAQLALSAEDVLRDIGIIAPDTTKETPEDFGSPEEETVYGALTSMPQPVDDLVEATGLSTGTIAASLTMLELSGYAKNVGNGHWVRT